MVLLIITFIVLFKKIKISSTKGNDLINKVRIDNKFEDSFKEIDNDNYNVFKISNNSDDKVVKLLLKDFNINTPSKKYDNGVKTYNNSKSKLETMDSRLCIRYSYSGANSSESRIDVSIIMPAIRNYYMNTR